MFQLSEISKHQSICESSISVGPKIENRPRPLLQLAPITVSPLTTQDLNNVLKPSQDAKPAEDYKEIMKSKVEKRTKQMMNKDKLD